MTGDERGYYLVAKDGGIFAFGDVRFYGSPDSINLNAPIVVKAIDPTNGGCDLFASGGGVCSFNPTGAYGFHILMGGMPLNQPIVGGVTY
ncbi:MAG: hypothetical protein M0019_11340 [Actinomycetota bacterium]|nr:hypothetical protein [Actinomycetota bacterium]